MDTLVLERGHSNYLVNAARLVRSEADVSSDLAEAVVDETWKVDRSNPFVQWIAGDFVEADNANSNGQYWTAGDLELAEYSIRYAPLNMVHKFRQPIGFYAATKTVKLQREQASQPIIFNGPYSVASTSSTITFPPITTNTANGIFRVPETADRTNPADKGSLKIQALSGLWSHIFPFEATQVEAADDAGLLFYSMECRGTHLTCASDNAKGLEGCGQTFDYMNVESHCKHLLDRSSVRHIVNPTFRGGAIIVPPVRPGWKNAQASVLQDAVMQEAASFAEQNEKAYHQLTSDGVDISASAWEQLMAMVVAGSRA